MGNIKGNSDAGVGYSCLMRELIKGYRAAWSATPGTTDPLAPFGVVALPTGGSEGGPNMGAMRIAQTASYGVLPNADRVRRGSNDESAAPGKRAGSINPACA